MGQSGDRPVFIMSIDTEMLWGPTDQAERDLLEGRGTEDREAIDSMLHCLNKHDISATWAIVGHLFQDQCDRSTCLTSRNMRTYHPEWYHDPYSDIGKEPLRYGADVVRKIISSRVPQEIGYHTYSHPIFTQITRAMAEEELKEAKRIERQWGLELTSFVFPQNEIAHVDILPKHGFTIFRGRSAQRWSREQSFLSKKVNGAMDKIIAPGLSPVRRGDIWEIGGSMPFWDVQVPGSLLIRARLGLRRAMANGQVFHIFIHPWSLMLYDRLREDLDTFLGYVSARRDEGELDVLTMRDYAASLNTV